MVYTGTVYNGKYKIKLRGGMITRGSIFHIIENISETELKDKIIHELKESGKNMIEDDFEFFIGYLKEVNFSAGLMREYICTESYGKARRFLTKLMNCFCIQNVNTDETLKLIRENATYILKRCSGWNVSEITLVDNSLDRASIKCAAAKYNHVNNWGHESYPFISKIIYNDRNILWIDKGSQNIPQYFIQKNENIYGLSYEHKFVTIYNKLDEGFKEFTVTTGKIIFDDIINKYEQGKQNIDNVKIDLSEYFYTGFFYKGMLFDGNWKKEITALKNIEFINGLLKIEIENLTYPHVGYVLLEIGENRIAEGFFVRQTTDAKGAEKT
jgi:hypothetical protein